MASRFAGPGKPFAGLAAHGRWTGEVRFCPEVLEVLLRRRKPTIFALNWMGDLFHDGVSNEQIAAMFGVMAATPRHTYLVLTKRVARLRAWFEWKREFGRSIRERAHAALIDAHCESERAFRAIDHSTLEWPLRHVWLGASICTQAEADRDLPILLATPAAHRWASLEPMLGPIRLDALNGGFHGLCRGDILDSALTGLRRCDCGDAGTWSPARPRLDAVVCGGESGPKARPCDVAWLRGVAEQCGAAGTVCLVKQAGANCFDSARPGGWETDPCRNISGAGADASEWPSGLSRGSVPWA